MPFPLLGAPIFIGTQFIKQVWNWSHFLLFLYLTFKNLFFRLLFSSWIFKTRICLNISYPVSLLKYEMIISTCRFHSFYTLELFIWMLFNYLCLYICLEFYLRHYFYVIPFISFISIIIALFVLFFYLSVHFYFFQLFDTMLILFHFTCIFPDSCYLVCLLYQKL